MINEYKWCRYQKERMGPLQLASLSIPRKHAKTHSMLRFFEVSMVNMSSNHAKSCNFSVRKLGAQPDGPGVTWSGLQAWTPWPSLFGLERSYQQKSIEIHRPTCLDANTRNHFLRNVQSCLGLGRLNLAKDAACQRLALQRNSRFVLSQSITNLNILQEKHSCVDIARSCLGLTQWFRF